MITLIQNLTETTDVRHYRVDILSHLEWPRNFVAISLGNSVTFFESDDTGDQIQFHERPVLRNTTTGDIDAALRTAGFEL